ncbi:sensor histidine kinase [Methylotenera sp. G11]|uniref:sensor histidine kinase n=1 Tax=Methylotenera sp. G11 TaxID=1506585 RepID=UPI00068C787D|nr:sensor histidine kinase [Methylotenera sp. G11]
MQKNPLNNQTARHYSLSGQLLLWLMICLFIILSISAVVSYSRAYRSANVAYDRALLREVLALAEQVDVVNNQVMIDLPEIARNLLEYDKDDFINYRISAPDGSLVVGEPAIKPPRKALASGSHIYYDDMLDNEKVRVVAYALPIINSELKGNLLIQVTETRTKREKMALEIIEEMLIPQILIMLVTAMVIFLSIKRSLFPLNQLRDSFARRSHEDLSPVVADNAPQEIMPLLNEMNDLMLRVKVGVDFQKAFVADASHQLRTPIAALQNQVELALREPVSAQVQHALENIAVSSRHLSRLVQQLLTLARIEPGTESQFEFKEVNLTQLVQGVTAEWVPRALSKNIDLGFESSESQDLIISGNAFMLREMLSNLIDNAICYTPMGGEVTVALSRQGDNAVLQVIDNGIGIVPAKRTLVFNRFYRVEANAGDGCGLGLAIVREIVLAHHATISIQDGLPHRHAGGTNVYGTNITVQFKTVDSKPYDKQ